MPSVHKTVLLPYSAEQMYTLVHDVEFYPAFLPWCSEAVVHERSVHHVVATLGIQFRGIRQSFSTENELHSRKIIELDGRPSDSIALAIQQGAPIYVSSEVWEEVEDRSDILRKMEEQKGDEA